jgi:hypothetical protein
LQKAPRNQPKSHIKSCRTVILDSALFHEADTINLKDVYQNRRINLTLFYGTQLPKYLPVDRAFPFTVSTAVPGAAAIRAEPARLVAAARLALITVMTIILIVIRINDIGFGNILIVIRRRFIIPVRGGLRIRPRPSHTARASGLRMGKARNGKKQGAGEC